MSSGTFVFKIRYLMSELVRGMEGTYEIYQITNTRMLNLDSLLQRLHW